MKPETLQLKKPLGNTVWWTLIIFFSLAGVAEWAVRLDLFQTLLTAPRMGSRHYQLGQKLVFLDTMIKKNGPVDCIMVGSSMVDVGFNPDAFQNGYQEVAGRDIACFNFGIDASSATSTAALVKILVEDFQPRLLLFGTDARDYAVSSEETDAAVILDTPWVQYRQGNFSLEGWLLENSYLFRYRQHLGNLLRLNLENTLWSHTHFSYPMFNNGFTPIDKTSKYINSPPAPEDDSFEVTYNTSIFSSYHMLNENLEALEKVMSYNGSETQVIIVEMPVSDGLYYFFGNGEMDYNGFVDQVSELADFHQVTFWRTEPLDMIPDDGWSDYSHLNVKGAELFSFWLGQQVGTTNNQR